MLEQMAVVYAAEIERLRAELDLAVKMREAQRRYFRTRTPSDLVAAKNLEIEFDRLTQAKPNDPA